MLSDPYKEAERVLTICNACRYCEGFCAVFPAMELRRTFSREDIIYLANLCHNCRDCYYACQYAPPHPFNVNFPRVMAQLRMTTYKSCVWPSWTGFFLGKWGVLLSISVVVASIAFFGLLGFIWGNTPESLDTKAGLFYSVVPYPLIILLFSLLAMWAIFGIVKGVRNLWAAMGGSAGAWNSLTLHARALKNALTLEFLGGRGVGCNYPAEEFSMKRRYLHHAVFYGFLLCFGATTAAFYYHHVLGIAGPYSWFSLPVVLGTVGGFAILVGTSGLVYLKYRIDSNPSDRKSTIHDLFMLALLFLIAFSGIFLLLLRGTVLMGLLLTVHLGLVAGLFFLTPCSKFIHGIYRYAALLKNAEEFPKGF
ncbi:tricarballylate utilization 4Fe-4S protein TcuB [Thermodesulforhabdus norvegica]|uniref:Citrate/tricarballylate utilization protein n=1 Tax=Thermodesulforhabdus norvegica TaxID=39841 RepID=A0A1I4QFE9_9BACT|nr:tricarballylate utilization 4Fe-4S protein TcuB [Thermodesulforhabdus norvegica]SFM38788.1 citrate/tricarballylate utilization protein [Thermodesulforhabdus norvegica]